MATKNKAQICTSATLVLYNVSTKLPSLDTIVPIFNTAASAEGSVKKPARNGNDNTADRYKITGYSMEVKEFLTTNCAAYRGDEQGGICKHCMQSYTGIGKGYSKRKALVGGIVYHYTADNYMCSGSCVKGYLSELRIDNPMNRVLYEQLTDELYDYPPTAQNWRLLVSGVCTLDEWKTDTFTPVIGYEVMPTKSVFVKK